MNKKLVVSAVLLLLSIVFGPIQEAAAKRSCTIACDTDPTIKCSSAVGDCSFYYGAYDYIVCDGEATRCPL